MSETELTHHLVIVPNYWGRGETSTAAWKRVSQESGIPVRELKRRGEWYKVHKGSHCEEIHGNIVYTKPHRPVELARGDKA